MQEAPVYSLALFGSPRLTVVDGTSLNGRAVQRHRIGLLALLATTYPRGRAREAVMALLWPEHDSASARKLLNQSVYVLRKSLGTEVITSDLDELRLDAERLAIDVVAFRAAIAQAEDARAVGLYEGAFLDGFYVNGAPAFNDWADRERADLAGMYAGALERLACGAERDGELAAAVQWWKARAAHDPCDYRAALRLMLALEALGDRAGALRQARLHEHLLRDELDSDPAPEVVALAERLRRSPAPEEPSLPTPPLAATFETDATDPVEAPAIPIDAARAFRRVRRWSLLRVAVAAVGVVGLGVAVVFAAGRGADHRLRGTGNIAAHEHYLRGVDGSLLRSDSGVLAGIEHFRRAVALDPDYAAAWAGLGKMYGRAAASAPRAERERYYTLGMQAAERAVALDDSLADAHATYGILLMGRFDFVAAERHMLRALMLDPGHANTHEWLVTLYLWVGRPDEALAHAERVVALDPLSPRANAELARALAGNDRCPEALEQLAKLESVQPPLLRVSSIAALCHARLQQWDAALAVLRAAPADASRSSASLMGFVLALAGRQEEALRTRQELLERWQRGEADAYDVALQFVGTDQLDEAYVWLNRAVEDRSLNGLPSGPAHNQVVGPLFAHVQHDPRFDDLKRRLSAMPASQVW